MLFLIFCIISSAALVVIFRYFAHFKVQVSQAIFINYVVCVVLCGVFFPESFKDLKKAGLGSDWLWAAAAAGFLYYVTFLLIAESTRTAGVAITSVAQKVSLVIPVAASLLLWQRSAGPVNLSAWLGLALALVAVGLASWRKKPGINQTTQKNSQWAWLLPVVVFLNAGMADTLLNFANHRYLKAGQEAAFTLAVFGTAAVLGGLTQFYNGLAKHEKFRWQSLLAGLILGIPNLLSLVLLLKTLTAFNNNGALVYPLLNIGVILVSALAGIVLFKEKLRRLNWLGLGLAVLALALLLANAGFGNSQG